MTPGTALLDTARRCLERGWSVLPVGPDKRPHLAALIDTGHSTTQGGVVRASWKPLQQQPPTDDHLVTWFSRPGRGLGLITGAVSGLIGLDYDGEAGRALAAAWGIRAHVQSRSGGLHQYLTHPGHRVPTLQSQTNPNLALLRGLDIRGDGGYLVLPPTAFGDTVRYLQLRPLEPDDLACIPSAWRRGDLSGNPRTLLHLDPPEARPAGPPRPRPWPTQPLHTRSAEHGDTQGDERDAPLAPEDRGDFERDMLHRALTKVACGDGRNSSGAWLAMQLRDHGYTAHEAEAVLHRYHDQVPATDREGRMRAYTHGEMLATLHSIYLEAARDGWWRPRPPTPPPRRARGDSDPLATIERCWPTLTPDQQWNATLLILGIRGPLAAQGEHLLHRLGVPTAPAKEALEARRAAGEALPGLSALTRLLQRLQPSE
ncbi:bifunctional DNA primase/polymerase [Deinococcus sonorensis]|uniref:Bifunctional DNA primase/polymerase n=1 Tax=Deinococcus sonorensis TaxID=309891 RepID=A0ABV8Y837_9DEIO